MKIRRSILMASIALLFPCIVAGVAQAALTPAPSWKIVAATGPTNLPPVQSEVQQLTVEAEGGTFSLAGADEGEGTLEVGSGQLSLVSESKVASVVSGTFKQGEQVKALSIPEGTTITNCASPCGAGESVELSNAATATKVRTPKIYAKEITGVVGTFHVGDMLSGSGIAPGTEVTDVGPGTLEISQFTTNATTETSTLIGTQTTSALPFDASAGEVQTALEAMSLLGTGSVTVTGGPGGEAANPYSITFGGKFADENVPQLAANGEALTGTVRYASVSTALPGGPGTGEIAVYAANIGGGPSSGTVTMHIGPLPTGVAITGEGGGKGWSCLTDEHEATCTSTQVVPAITPALPFGIPVAVQQATGLSADVEVSVSDEQGHHASYEMPIVVSAQPAQAGLAAFWAGAFEVDGTPSTQAGAHPYSDLNWFLVNTTRSKSAQIVPAGDLKDVNAELTPGFLGDPLITGRCPQGLLAAGENELFAGCNREESSVGRLGPGLSFTKGEAIISRFVNDVPVGGAAAQFSALFGGPLVTLLGSLRTTEDYGISVSADHIPSTVTKTYSTFVAFEGFPNAANGKAFFRNPTDCGEQGRQAPTQSLEASTWQQPTSFDKVTQQLVPVTGCDKLKFEPEFSFQPSSANGSSPVGATAHLHIDQSGLTDPSKLATPDLKTSVVTLPQGLDLNPSQANGLEACSEAQVGYKATGPLPNPTRFNDEPVTCPDGSKLGTVEATSPLLEEPLKGTVYLAAQEENPFGSLIALYLVIESPRFGITLKLPGKVETDPSTGQVTATFDYVPQQPVEDLTLNFRGGGPHSEFATPEVCGTYSTKGSWTPWSAPESGPPAQTSDPFTVSTGCSSSAATRPFAPSFEAGTTNPLAAAYSPLVIKVNRNDGEQELTSLNFTLPEGLIGNLASVPYCPDTAIEAARAKTGRAEQASPSCPAASQIGSVDAAAGVGSEPIHVGGHVYMAGPYEGAPLSAVVITPAVAGPFDLGDVVVRAPLFVNSTTAQIAAKSDPLPTILRGIPLKLRSVAITIDRSNFTLNPTSCAAMSVTSSIGSSDGATATPSNRFQVGGCAGLPFKPSLSATTAGNASKANGASLVVKIAAKPGEANIHKVNLQLPLQLPSRLTTLQKACTEAQFNVNPAACPADSVIGTATAHTPILQVPLTGPAYLVSHGGAAFPDVEFVLQANERGGNIEIVLDGETRIKNGITYSNFETVPDAPISSFETVLPTGPHSILTANLPTADKYNLCGQALKMPTTFTGQNGAVLKQSTPIAVTGCAPSIRLTKHTVKGNAATFIVSVPSAGKLTAKGAGLTSAAKTVSAAKSVTLKLKVNKKEQTFLVRHPHRKLKVHVKLQFTPKHGSRLATSTTVLIG